MCGISGIFSPAPLRGNHRELVAAMNRRQAHRGPDDEGLFADAHCVLGHRRLSIIDLSTAGRQPFTAGDGRFRLVYNGEIYNYLELRQELAGRGRRFTTGTDTEVLLAAYLEYGDRCLARLNGMFAFAVYDCRERTLFLARDRVGIKPLYYFFHQGVLFFASEIKALAGIHPGRLSVDYGSVFDYLVFNRTDVFDRTFFSEISRFPKGHCGRAGPGGLTFRRWWNPDDFLTSGGRDDEEEVCRRVRELFLDAARLRMRSDVPVGSCLSGGLDSSILLGALRAEKLAGEDYTTYTAAFPGEPLDETGYIDGLRDSYTFVNHRTFPTADSALANLRDFVYANDEPTTNPSFYSQYEVMRLAREKGVTVLLDGQGGDESFAGYQYFHGFFLYGLLRRGQWGRFLAELGRVIVRRQHVSAHAILLYQLLPHRVRLELLRGRARYLAGEFVRAQAAESLIFREFFRADGLNRSLARHFQYKLEHLLRIEDRNSMRFSIEARVPYLDYRLVEYLLGVEESLKIRAGETKYLQKKALGRFTTNEILERRDKLGFAAPTARWMAAPGWRDLAEESFREVRLAWPEIFPRGVRLPVSPETRWKLIQLAVWKDIFL